MSTALIYRTSSGYEAVMRLLYGRHYKARYRVLAELVPTGATVCDVCCGPAVLYRRYLRQKGVNYTGVDVNEHYVRRLVAAGGNGVVCDVRRASALPRAEIVVMQASLYHFLPDARSIVDKLLAAATRRVIIAEPIRNLADHPNRFVAAVTSRMTNAGSGPQAHRFTEETFDALLAGLASAVTRAFLIPGGREKVYVFGTSR